MPKIKYTPKELDEWKKFSSWSRQKLEKEKDKMSKEDYEFGMEVFNDDPKHITEGFEGFGNILVVLAIGSMYDEYQKELSGDMSGQSEVSSH